LFEFKFISDFGHLANQQKAIKFPIGYTVVSFDVANNSWCPFFIKIAYTSGFGRQLCFSV
jgi:hypothetical protein